MKTLNLYIAALYSRLLLTILAALVSLYSIVEFIEKVDDFIEHGATFGHYLLYPLYNLPLIFSNTLPMAALLAAFATIGALSRTSQLTALFGSGVSFSQINRPLFLCGLLLCFITLIGNGWVLPLANREAHYLFRTDLKGAETVRVTNENLYLRIDNKILNIADSFPHKQEISGISLLTFNDHFQLIQRLEAERGYFEEDGRWRLTAVKIWGFSAATQEISSYASHDQQIIDLAREPDNLLQLWQIPEDMTLFELTQNAARLRSEGRNAIALQVELQLRLAKSVNPLIMILLGIPFAFQRGRQASLSAGFITCLIIFVWYFLLQAIFTAFGNAMILPPIVAGWAANLLLALAGIWLFIRMQE